MTANIVDLVNRESEIIKVTPNEVDLRQLLASLRPGPVCDLAEEFIHSTYYGLYCQVPAAQKYHHNYPGGLLEHSLGTAKIALKMADLHPEIDGDLILVGALFHDLGKVQELKINEGIGYTDEGKLLGHIVLGLQILEKLMDRIKIDNTTRLKLLHMIASHHGNYEWQSPKKPVFLEAKVLHLADMMDAEIWKFKSALPATEGNSWSVYVKSIGSEVYLG